MLDLGDLEFAPLVCVYHGHCSDGFGAAWALHQRFSGRQETFFTAANFPSNYSEAAGETIYLSANYTDHVDWQKILFGRNVLIFDYSLPRAQLEEVAANANFLLLADHHATAQAALGDLPYCHFDMEKSGAVLAWEMLHDKPVPGLLAYVQDRDLYRWELSNSRTVSNIIQLLPQTFPIWDCLFRDGVESFTELAPGVTWAVTALADQQVARGLEWWNFCFNDVTVLVPVVNTPMLVSETCEALYNKFGNISATYYLSSGKMIWSLRAAADCNINVSLIAAAFGGGGHPKSAGFSLPIGDLTPIDDLTLATRILRVPVDWDSLGKYSKDKD